jgi:hypothetical protein
MNQPCTSTPQLESVLETEGKDIPGCCIAIVREARLKGASFEGFSSRRSHCHLGGMTGRD